MQDAQEGGRLASCAGPGPLVRRWTTGLFPGRAPDYERFARETSLAMFQDAPGCLAVYMSGTDERRSVTTVWLDLQHLDAFERSARYTQTVSLIASQGFLTGEQSVTFETAQLLWHAPTLGENRSGPD